MPFDFDPKKSRENAEKHGISFVQAMELWRNPTVEFPSKYPSEERRLVIGRMRTLYWTAIITPRDDVIRIISVRRSRREEKELYDKAYPYKDNPRNS